MFKKNESQNKNIKRLLSHRIQSSKSKSPKNNKKNINLPSEIHSKIISPPSIVKGFNFSRENSKESSKFAQPMRSAKNKSKIVIKDQK